MEPVFEVGESKVGKGGGKKKKSQKSPRVLVISLYPSDTSITSNSKPWGVHVFGTSCLLLIVKIS